MTEQLKTMELTESEARIILNRRALETHKAATKDFQLRAIKVASDYFLWCCQPENGFYFPDSGTFVNEFGYQEDDHSIMRNAVEEIWKLVFPFEIPKEKTQC
ncbi:hypothetical protein ACG93T_17435 [Acinetobacter beijerinckii]|uniref:hypothetical protein n=1 Tax=Acinetobacter beijerinckii TaxID=262668 RepID=UPI003AF5298E